MDGGWAGRSLCFWKTGQDVTSGQELSPQGNGSSQEEDRWPAPSRQPHTEPRRVQASGSGEDCGQRELLSWGFRKEIQQGNPSRGEPRRPTDSTGTREGRGRRTNSLN